MKKVLFACFTVALLIGLAANACADIITSHTNPQTYYETAGSHDWVLSNFDGDKDTWTFLATNTETGATVGGNLTSWGQSGNSGFHTIESIVPGTIKLRHNTSIHTTLAFSFEDMYNLSDGFVDSFYFLIDPHDNSNDLKLEIKATAYINGEFKTETLYQVGGGFFGYTLEEGYFTEFTISVDYGKNNGGYIGLTVGLGDVGVNKIFPDVTPPGGGGTNITSTATPEPATLLILGLGLAGAGVAARRRK